MVPFLATHKRNVAIAFGMAVIGMVINAITPLVEKIIVDDVIVHHRRSLAPLLIVLIGAGAVTFVASFVRRFIGGRVALDVQYDMRNAIFERLQRLDFATHDELQTGQLVSRASSDVGLLQGLLSFLPLMLGNLIMTIVAFVVMFVLSPPLTLVALAAVPALFLLSIKLRKTMFPASWDAQQKIGEVAGVVDEAVTGVRVVKGFGQEERELRRLIDVGDRLYKSKLRVIRLTARYSPALQSIPVLAQVGVLAFGGWLAIHGHVTIGTFLAFSSYMVQLTAPVRQFSMLLAIGQQARAGGERILDLLDANPLVVEQADAAVLPKVHGEIEIDDVVFGYTSDEPVLDRFTLHVRAGETVALVGASGSGKSTIALLLPRFYDVKEGAVRVDGVDVREVTLDSLRSQIGVVFEDSFLFSDSVRNNIAFGRPHATEDEILAAARAAEADRFISELPEGYDTVVGELGLTLSGGQRQRVALARALITDPRILLLDDATSAVDSRTEEEIHATLRKIMRGRTTILVAHRRSTLRLADRIVVLDHGRVSAEGTHEELLERSPLYRLLLSGPGEDIENEDDSAVAGADVAAGADGAAGNVATTVPGVTPAAWRPAPDTRNPVLAANSSAPAAGARVGLGGGLGGGGGGGGGVWGGTPLAATPQLLAAVASLPPADDEPRIDTEHEAEADDRFSLRRFSGPYRRPLGIGLALVVFDTLLTLAGPFLVRRGLDHGVTKHAEGALWIASAMFATTSLLDWIVTWSYTRYTGRTAERMLYALRIRIFSHLQRLSVDFYEREMAGRVMTRMTTDVDALSQLLQSGLISAVVSLFSFFGVIIVLGFMNLRLTLTAMAIVVPPLLVATVWFRRRSDRAYGRARDRIAIVNANLQESLSGVRVSQAYVREEKNMGSFRAVSADYLDARLDAQRLVAIYFPFVQFLSAVADAVVLGVGSVLVARGSLTAGAIIAFVLYLDQFFSPIQQLSQVFDVWQQARASMRKIDELMAIPSSTPLPEHPVDPGRLRGAVRFEDAHFKYPTASTEALRGVNLDIRAGETIALVGETGAGKSTVVKLVARFYDVTAGRVLIDGVAVTELDLGLFRRQLGYVPQEAFLFGGTIRDNIAYGRPEAGDAEVEAAARAVGAHDFIAGLPGGYLHAVSERGRSMSSGQRQLIALARARLVDPAILLLDEATSNLDLATEAKVQRAMGVVARGRTTILIAHRLQTAMGADRIVVMDAGLVAEVGSHAELLARGGRYADMWNAFEGEEPVAVA
jgi:ATP-binding cassette subfamily B protein